MPAHKRKQSHPISRTWIKSRPGVTFTLQLKKTSSFNSSSTANSTSTNTTSTSPSMLLNHSNNKPFTQHNHHHTTITPSSSQMSLAISPISNALSSSSGTIAANNSTTTTATTTTTSNTTSGTNTPTINSNNINNTSSNAIIIDVTLNGNNSSDSITPETNSNIEHPTLSTCNSSATLVDVPLHILSTNYPEKKSTIANQETSATTTTASNNSTTTNTSTTNTTINTALLPTPIQLYLSKTSKIHHKGYELELKVLNIDSESMVRRIMKRGKKESNSHNCSRSQSSPQPRSLPTRVQRKRSAPNHYHHLQHSISSASSHSHSHVHSHHSTFDIPMVAPAAGPSSSHGCDSPGNESKLASNGLSHRDAVEMILKNGLALAKPVAGVCQICSSRKTGQWRRGPHGPRTLCNGCGLAWAKKVKIFAAKKCISVVDAEKLVAMDENATSSSL